MPINTANPLRPTLAIAAAGLALFAGACGGDKTEGPRFTSETRQIATLTDVTEVTNAWDRPIRMNIARFDADVAFVEQPGVRRTTIEVTYSSVADKDAWDLSAVRDDTDGTLVIEVIPADPLAPRVSPPRRLSIEVRTPSASLVNALVRNGDVTVIGLGSPDRPGRADITGTVLNSNNGAISVRDHNGPVRATINRGTLDIEGGIGEVDGNVADGGAIVTGREGGVALAVGTGTAQIDAAQGRFEVKVGNGAIRVQLDPDWVGRYQAIETTGVGEVISVGEAAADEALSRATVATGTVTITGG